MDETADNKVTADLTFKVPQKVGWSVQSSDQSWTGSELDTLVTCLTQETRSKSITLSLSLIFELTGSEGTLRSSLGMLPGDGQ